MLGWMKTWWNPAPFSRDASNSAEKRTMVGGNPKRCAVSMAWDSPTWKKKTPNFLSAAAGNSGCFFLLFGSPPHWLSIGRWVGPSCTSQQKKNATYNQSKLKGEQNQGFHSMAAVMVRSSWRFGRHAAAARAGECVGFLCFTNDDYQGPKAMHILNHQDPSHSQAARVFFLQANEGVKQHPFPRDDHHLDISCDQSIQTMGWGAPERDHVIDLLKLLCLLFLNRIIDQKLWRSHQNTPAWQQFDRLYPSLQCTKCIETLT